MTITYVDTGYVNVDYILDDIIVYWDDRVIFVPKVSMTRIQITPIEIRELDLNTFHLKLRGLEDDEDGVTFRDTHVYVPPITVGGVQLARVLTIINDYTVTFEDGPYIVNIVNGNSNVADRRNPNNTSVQTANSAGLVQTREIEHTAFNDYVTVDPITGISGTSYPTGTRQQPSNNLTDALLIASIRGLDEIRILSPITIENTDVVDEFIISSDNWTNVTIAAGASTVNTVFQKVGLYGELSGFWNVLIDCWTYDITNFCGWIRGGSIINLALAPYTVESSGQSYFDDLVPFYPGVTSNIIFNTDVKLSLTGCRDIVTFNGLTAGSFVIVGLAEGILNIANTCVGGTIEVSGVGEIESNLGTSTVDSSALVNPETVWANPLTIDQPVGSASRILQNVASDSTTIKNDVIQINNAVDAIDILTHLLLKYQKNRTKVDSFAKTLTIYDNDNITPITVFNLKDLSGTASVTEVAEREPI